MTNIAINGLGRIGRVVLKILEATDDAEVVAVNDLIPPDNLAYLLRYDIVYGHAGAGLQPGPAVTLEGLR